MGDDLDDCLDYRAFADALAEVIDNPVTDTPLAIAISAPWGAGKTTLAQLLERRLLTKPVQRGELPHITCWFNAWMHDDAPNLATAFAAEIAKQAEGHRTRFRRIFRPLPSAILSPSHRARRRLYVVAISLVIAAIAAVPLRNVQLLDYVNVDAKLVEHIQNTVGLGGSALLFVVIPILFAAWDRLFSTAQAVAGFVKDPTKESGTGSMREVSNQLGALLHEATHRDSTEQTAGKRRFVIFVDDIERCTPLRAVEICKVANQLLSHSDVVTVLVADMAAIAACADVQYSSLDDRYPAINSPKLGNSTSGATYGQVYLEKIVQIQFDIPTPSIKAIQHLIQNSSTREVPPGLATQPEVLAAANSGRKEQVLDVVSRWGWKISLALSVTFFILGVALAAANSNDAVVAIVNSLLLFSFVIFVFIRIGLAARRRVRRRKARHLTRQVDEQIKKSAGRIKFNGLDPLVTQRLQRHEIDDLLQQANTALLPFLPALPRSAKRLYNQLHLLLAVAVNRKMLDGDSTMTAQHLAKWAALTSQWPELSSALSATPEAMSDLEGAADISELTDRLGSLNYHQPVTQELFGILHSSIKLAPVMARLVAYEAASVVSGPTTAAADAKSR